MRAASARSIGRRVRRHELDDLGVVRAGSAVDVDRGRTLGVGRDWARTASDTGLERGDDGPVDERCSSAPGQPAGRRTSVARCSSTSMAPASSGRSSTWARRGARSRPSAEAGRSTTSLARSSVRTERTRPARRARTARSSRARDVVGRGHELLAPPPRSRTTDEQGAAARLGHRLVGAQREHAVAHDHDRDHPRSQRCDPIRSPSMTAAWARRGATQSPTRWTSTLRHVAVSSWYSRVHRRGRHGEHDPVARQLGVLRRSGGAAG